MSESTKFYKEKQEFYLIICTKRLNDKKKMKNKRKFTRIYKQFVNKIVNKNSKLFFKNLL